MLDDLIEWLWGKTLCRFGHHQPCLSIFGKDDDCDIETICICCGCYLKNGKVTTDPEVIDRVNKFNEAVHRDLMTL
jgi:hypothetical protein